MNRKKLSVGDDLIAAFETTPLYAAVPAYLVTSRPETGHADRSDGCKAEKHESSILYGDRSNYDGHAVPFRIAASRVGRLTFDLFALLSVISLVFAVCIGVQESAWIIGTADVALSNEPENCPKIFRPISSILKSSGSQADIIDEELPTNLCYMYRRVRSFLSWKDVPRLSVFGCSAYIDFMEIYSDPGEIISSTHQESAAGGTERKMHVSLKEPNDVWPIFTARDVRVSFWSWIFPVINLTLSDAHIEITFDDMLMTSNNLQRFLSRLPSRPEVETYPKIGVLDIQNLTISLYSKRDFFNRANGGQRILLGEVHVQKDILGSVKQATSEAGREGTDQLYIEPLLQRVLDLSLRLALSDPLVETLYRQVQQLEKFINSQEKRKEDFVDAWEEWKDQVSLQWKNAWDNLQHKVTEHILVPTGLLP